MPRSAQRATVRAQQRLAHISLHHACAILLTIACRSREPAAPVPVPPPALPQTTTAIAVVPDFGPDRRAYMIDQAPGLDLVITGSLRAELTPDQVHFAEGQLAATIICVARVNHGWLFLTADGAVARADSFLGTLQPLGHVPRPSPDAPIVAPPVMAGRLAFATADPHASLWTTDGTAPIVCSTRATNALRPLGELVVAPWASNFARASITALAP